MAYLAQMPDVDAIQAENERVFASMREAETTRSNMVALRAETQETVETLPLKIGIGGVAVIIAVYWLLIRR